MKNALHISSCGFSLMTVIFVILATAIVGTAVISLISTSSQMLIDEQKAQQAFDLAQAGLSYTAQELVGDNDWSDNFGGTVSFGPGFFTTTYVEQTASTVTVRSVGDVDGVRRTVKQEFTRGTPACFESAIYTEGDFSATGGSEVSVDGPITTGGTVDVTGNSDVDLSGPVNENHASADIPDVDWSYWKSTADHVILSDYTFGDGTYSGIYYVSGQTQFTSLSGFTLNGSLISRGMVHINASSNVTITAQPHKPAIVAEDRIQINNDATLNVTGWIFGLEKFLTATSSNFTIDGGITAGSEIKMTGHSTVDVEHALDMVPDIGFIGGEPGSGTGGATIMYGDWSEEL